MSKRWEVQSVASSKDEGDGDDINSTEVKDDPASAAQAAVAEYWICDYGSLPQGMTVKVRLAGTKLWNWFRVSGEVTIDWRVEDVS